MGAWTSASARTSGASVMPSGDGARLRQWLIAASISGIWMAVIGRGWWGWGGGWWGGGWGGGRGGDWRVGSRGWGVWGAAGHIQGAQPGARHFTGTGRGKVSGKAMRRGRLQAIDATTMRHDNAP